MFTLILITLVLTFVWFFYTDRRNTVTATKTSLGLVGHSIKEGYTMAKTEADIAKVHNDIANLESDRLEKFADRNAKRIITQAYEDLGLGKEFKTSQQSRLEEIKGRLEAAKAKAGK